MTIENHVTDYRRRVADGLLERALRTSGAAQIVGPKWCGKTTTAERAAKKAIYFQDPDNRASYLRLSKDKPSLLLQGEKPLLLDEWQDAPVMWDAVRFAVDRNNAVGQFILTGSSVPPDREILHSGAGRFSKIRMRPMSLFESGESNGTVSLGDLFEKKDVSATCALTLEDFAAALVRGGWPASVTQGGVHAADRAIDYVESIIESDISKVDGIEKNPKRVRLLMRSLARNESTEASMKTLQADMAADESSISVNTVALYLNALRRLFVIEEQEAWAPAVRSKTAIRTSPKRRYCDPSVAAALLRLSPEKLMVDFNTFGMLFESLCVRDLKTYAEAIDGSVSHYRDARGLECDAVIELGDGRWGAAEIKLGQSQIEKGVNNLLKIRDCVRSQHGGDATFLMVLTSENTGYRRDDGVYIVPAGCLKP